MLWKSDEELYRFARQELFTGVVGDVMDRLGFRHQFLPPEIRPLHPDMVVIGRTMPLLQADCFESVSSAASNLPMDRPFGLMLHALDDLKPNEVYTCTGSLADYALWGELMSIRAIKLGSLGAVVNGYSRDTRSILALGFPVFSCGTYAQDQIPRGKVVDYRVPIEVGQVRILPGDIIFGDRDGVCVIPRSAEFEVFSSALDKVRGEHVVREALNNGMSAREAFKRFGIL